MFIRDASLKQEKWTPGFRVIGVSSHNVVAERASRIFKYPRFKVRMYPAENQPATTLTDGSNENSDASTVTPTECAPKMTVGASISYTEGKMVCVDSSSGAEVDSVFIQEVHNECSSSKWLESASSYTLNPVDDSIMTLGKEEMHIENCEMGALNGADINRTTPRFFLKCPRALNAIKKELSGLLLVRYGQSALELTTSADSRWRGNARVHSTIVTKRKSTSEFKARLVLRGGRNIGAGYGVSKCPNCLPRINRYAHNVFADFPSIYLYDRYIARVFAGG